MLQHAATGPRDLRGLLEQPDEDGELAGPIFRDIISYLYGRSMPVSQGTEVLQLEPAEEIFGFLSERRARIKQDAARALRACALPLDEWHQAVASALLIAPHLAWWAVSAPIGMSPRPEDQSDLERQALRRDRVLRADGAARDHSETRYAGPARVRTAPREAGAEAGEPQPATPGATGVRTVRG